MGKGWEAVITLREIRGEDAKDMLEWMHDTDSQKGFRRNMLDTTLEDAKRFCREARLGEDWRQAGNIHLAIADNKDEYLGTISFKKISLEYRSAEMAISLRKKARGGGIGAEAVRLLLRIGFEELGLHRVYLTVLADNTAAIKLYERCGFTFEGELRDHLFLNGRYVSWKVYGILDREYCEKWQ